MTDNTRTRPFHERFDIEVGTDQAKSRFVVRVANIVFEYFLYSFLTSERHKLEMLTLSALGSRYISNKRLSFLVGKDFHRNLQALEGLYGALVGTNRQSELSDLINRIIRDSEVDLGIDWQPPIFVPTGAPFLDEGLVNEQLRWLAEPKYRTVYGPFEKGLSHFLESEKKPQLLGDVVTDMYEAVEALAKIITGRPNKDLSANREQFISKVKVSDNYKKLLREYISYANEFRHAEQEQKPRPSISRPEAESFVYLTGLFIRLAVQRS